MEQSEKVLQNPEELFRERPRKEKTIPLEAGKNLVIREMTMTEFLQLQDLLKEHKDSNPDYVYAWVVSKCCLIFSEPGKGDPIGAKEVLRRLNNETLVNLFWEINKLSGTDEASRKKA